MCCVICPGVLTENVHRDREFMSAEHKAIKNKALIFGAALSFSHYLVHSMHTRPFKKNEVLIFGAALGFSHYLVHLKPIGTILNEIDQYLDLPHRL